MPTVSAATIAKLRRSVEEAKRLPIPVGPNLVPDGCVWPPRDEALEQALDFILDLQTQINGLPAASISPLRRIYLTKNADDPYNGDLQAAINAAVDPTPDAPWVVEILSPGIYTGNFVGRENVYVVSLSCGPGKGVVLRSANGFTYTMPATNTGLQGVSIETTSGSTTDAALRILGGSGQQSSFFILGSAESSGAARALLCDAGTNGFVGIFIGISGDVGTPVAAEFLSGSLFMFSGSLSSDSDTGLLITGGATVFVGNTLCGISDSAGGWFADVDGGTLGLLSGIGILSMANGVRLQNGSFAALLDVSSFATPATALDVDATSTALIGRYQHTLFATDWYAPVTVAAGGTLFFAPTSNFVVGTVGGPDTRPSNPQPGMRFYATDQPAGARQLVFIPGTGWVDQTDTLVP